MKITDAAGMEAAAKLISEKYHCAVLCKGGHQINDADDLLWRDGCGKWFRGKRIANPNTHGTGCTLSSAIASNLAKGYNLDASVGARKGLHFRLSFCHAGSGPRLRPHGPHVCTERESLWVSEQTFVQQLVQESLPVWEKCLHSEFLTHLADGTLDEACFKGYIVEDSLYLREYAKVFAWGMTKAKDMQTIRTYYSLLSFVNESEDAARLHYLKHFGLTDEGIQSLPLRPENRAYVDSMIEAAKNGEGAAECMMACLPCMLSYGWIFQKLLEEKPSVQDTLYGALVVDYADKGL